MAGKLKVRLQAGARAVAQGAPGNSVPPLGHVSRPSGADATALGLGPLGSAMLQPRALWPRPSGAMARPEPILDDFNTAELVMEMLKRGYAVVKMPEDGGLPEVLK